MGFIFECQRQMAALIAFLISWFLIILARLSFFFNWYIYSLLFPFPIAISPSAYPRQPFSSICVGFFFFFFYVFMQMCIVILHAIHVMDLTWFFPVSPQRSVLCCSVLLCVHVSSFLMLCVRLVCHFRRLWSPPWRTSPCSIRTPPVMDIQTPSSPLP